MIKLTERLPDWVNIGAVIMLFVIVVLLVIIIYRI